MNKINLIKIKCQFNKFATESLRIIYFFIMIKLIKINLIFLLLIQVLCRPLSLSDIERIHRRRHALNNINNIVPIISPLTIINQPPLEQPGAFRVAGLNTNYPPPPNVVDQQLSLAHAEIIPQMDTQYVSFFKLIRLFLTGNRLKSLSTQLLDEEDNITVEMVQ